MTGDRQARQAWPFGDLVPLSYHIIAADCPWRFKVYGAAGAGRSAGRHYRTLTLGEIQRLPVHQLAAGDCLLVMWATWPMLRFAFEVIDAWGFVYKTGGSWVKTTKSGGDAMGTGYLIRNACEPYLLATLGSPQTRRDVRSVVRSDILVERFDDLIEARRREHSRKPDELFQIIDRLVPRAARKAELFARERRDGWDAWGDEVGKFGDGS